MREADLILALRQRDESALAYAFEHYSDRLYRLALSLLHDEQLAEDALQETFITLIQQIDSFEGRSALSTWLYRVAYNHCLGQLRRQRPQLELDENDEPELTAPEHLLDWSNIPETIFSDSESNEQVMRAIQHLNPTLRAVFWLRDIEELNTEETATALGISEGAVKVRLHRARLVMREQLAGYFEERVR